MERKGVKLSIAIGSNKIHRKDAGGKELLEKNDAIAFVDDLDGGVAFTIRISKNPGKRMLTYKNH